MEQVTFKDFLVQIPVRFAELIVKLISVKVVILAGFFWLHTRSEIETWALVVIAGFVIFGREFFKVIEKVR